jgi:predicted O-methyltransferase YrrM
MYKFDNSEVGSLAYPIIALGDNIVGVEIGAMAAQSSCCLLQKCPNIKTMYLVDPYQPYLDELHDVSFGEKEMEFEKLRAYHHVKYSGCQDKVIFIEKTEELAADDIEDNSLDFVYIDSWVTVSNIMPQLARWYSKLKPGGIFSGHDWHHDAIQILLNEFRTGKNFKPLYNVNNTWMWYK